MPGQEAFAAIWDAWNARSPQAQVADALVADNAVIERFESATPQQRDGVALTLFGGMEFDFTGLVRMRLGEHAVHTWDVAVALDPAATVAPEAVSLLIDTLGWIASRGKPDAAQRRLHVTTTGPERRFLLETGESVSLAADDGGEGAAELTLPAEALLRLVYGRLDPDHTPPLAAGDAELPALRQIFPGF
jgi:hypothetical protein